MFIYVFYQSHQYNHEYTNAMNKKFEKISKYSLLNSYHGSCALRENFIGKFFNLPMLDSPVGPTNFLDGQEIFFLGVFKTITRIVKNPRLDNKAKQERLESISSLTKCCKLLQKVKPFLSKKDISLNHAFISVRSHDKKEFFKKFNKVLGLLEEADESAFNLFVFSFQKSLLLYKMDLFTYFSRVPKNSFLTFFTGIFLEECNITASKNFKKFNFGAEFTKKDLVLLAFHFGEILEVTQVVKLEREPLEALNSAYLYEFETRLLSVFVGLRKIELPLLVKPLNWVLGEDISPTSLLKVTEQVDTKMVSEANLAYYVQKETVQLNGGGYLYNKSFGSEGVHLKCKTSFTRAKAGLAESVNSLQNQNFNINKSCFRYLNSNRLECLLEYLKAYNLNSLDIFTTIYNSAGETLTLEARKALKAKDILSIKSCHFFVFGSCIDQAIDAKARLKFSYYKTYLGFVIRFITTVTIANIFKNNVLWFSAFVDFRSRVYFAGGSIKPQGDCLSQFLLDFPKRSTKEGRENLNSKDAISLKHSLKNLELNKALMGKNFFKLRRLEFRTVSLIGLDVSSSGAQILSGIVGYKKGLVNTNFFRKSIRSSDQDFYNDIRLDFLNYFSTESKKIKTLNVDALPFGLSVEVLSIFFVTLEMIFSRSFVKNWTMCFFYGEGNKARGQQLYYELLSIHSGIKKFTGFIKICEKVARLLPSFVDAPLTEVIKFIKSKFKGSNQGVSYLNLDGLYLSSSKRFLVRGSESIKLVNRSKKYLTHVVKMDTGKINRPKLIIGSVVHFVHFLDATLAHRVILESKKHNIALFTNHDCFYVEHKNTELIKKIYFESFVEIILKGDVLACYLEANNLKLEPKDLKQLAEWSKARKLLAKQIEYKKLHQSFYILKP